MKTNKRKIIIIVFSTLIVVAIIIGLVLSFTNTCGEYFINDFSIGLSALGSIISIYSIAAALIKDKREKKYTNSNDINNNAINGYQKKKYKEPWSEKFNFKWDTYTKIYFILIFAAIACITSLIIMSFKIDLAWGCIGSIVALVLAIVLIMIYAIAGFFGEAYEAVEETALFPIFYIILMLSLTVFLIFPIPILYLFIPIFGFILLLMLIILPIVFIIRDIIKKDTNLLVVSILSAVGTISLCLGSFLVICLGEIYWLMVAMGIIMNIGANINMYFVESSKVAYATEIIYIIVFWLGLLALIFAVLQIVRETIPSLGEDLISALHQWCEWIKKYWWRPWIIP